MMSKIEQKYGLLIGMMCCIINRYDPQGLIRGGCPLDEYSPEAKELVLPLLATNDPTVLCKNVWYVFKKMFSAGEDTYGISWSNCVYISRDLLQLKKSLRRGYVQ